MNSLGNKNEYQEIVVEICRAVKFHNPQALFNIQGDDLQELARSLAQSYDIETVRTSRDEVMKNHVGKSLTIGVFMEKCLALQRSKQDLDSTQAMITKHDGKTFGVHKENFNKVRELLKGATQKLPYNQKYLVWGDGKPEQEAAPLPPASLADLPAPQLYDSWVKTGITAPVDSIQDPELRTLYEKAWTKGLSSEERRRFEQLAKGVDHGRSTGTGVTTDTF